MTNNAPIDLSLLSGLTEPLNIMLVNDDGYDSEGIEAMRDELLALGHSVTVVAPAGPQSGKGTSIDADKIFQPVTITEFRPGDFNVDGTPVTTVTAGLDYLLEGNTPDLVISGINEGANLGEIANNSGTVSAAVTALLRGVPSIAISANVSDDPAEAAANYEAAAKLTGSVVTDIALRKALGLDLLPEGTALNINVPEGWNGEDVAYTSVTGTNAFDFDFPQIVPGEDDVLFSFTGAAPTGSADSETVKIAEGFATISPMDGDWSAPEEIRAQLEARLDDLSATDVDQASESLNIMLVNDDGYDAAGIQTMAAALIDAGHNVTIIAPAQQQSGQGTNLDVASLFQVIDVNVIDGGYSVDSTPVIVTEAGLKTLYDGTPDLVVSGINSGENVGKTAISSGTVSAAVTAILGGVPAIAVSGGMNHEFEVTQDTFDTGAAFTVDLIADLIASADGGPLLPEGTGLSVNVPDSTTGEVAFTRLDAVTPLEIGFGAPYGYPTVDISFGEGNGDPLSEGTQFLDGKITVTPIDGNYVPDAETSAEVIDAVDYGPAFSMLFGDPSEASFEAALSDFAENQLGKSLVLADRWAAEGNKGDNWVVGNSRHNLLDGGKGDDMVSGGDGHDMLKGGKGDDLLDGGNGHDYLNGEKGADFLKGRTGNDALSGEKGNDTLDGGEGNDFIDGGKGRDELTGGEGADTFFFTRKDGKDVITDFDASEDMLKFSKRVDEDDISFSLTEGELTLEYGRSDEIVFTGLTLEDANDVFASIA